MEGEHDDLDQILPEDEVADEELDDLLEDDPEEIDG